MTKWLTVQEAAVYLKVSKSKLYQLARDKEIPHGKVGVQWRFDQKELDRWVRRHHLKAPRAPRKTGGKR